MEMMLSLSMLYFIIQTVSSQDLRLHHQMTPEEVQVLFRTHPNDVPEYEVVPIAHAIRKRNSSESPYRILQMRSFKRDIRLYLEPTEGILVGKTTPMWIVEGDSKSPLGIKYTQISHTLGDLHHFYQDPCNHAALTSTYDENGEILFDGTIGDDLVVRPLPARLRKEYSRFKRSINEENFPQFNRTVHHPNLENTHHHVVIKKKNLSIDGMREKIGSYVLKNESSRLKRSTNDGIEVPGTVYPQILVILDHDEYLSLQSLVEVRRYVISFWNAVDLRYRVFTEPNVRLNIAGIIVATDPMGLPYIQNHLSKHDNRSILNADSALDDMARYFFNETMEKSLQRFLLERDYDIAVAMTKSELCNFDLSQPKNKAFDCTTLGFAFRGGACTVNLKDKMVESVAIVEDNGGYSGIVPAAHEIGHLMGAPHDGYSENDKMICPAYGGYIMTDVIILTENIFSWSSCSMEYFQEFFHSPRAECIFDPPKRSRTSPRILPGTIISLDEQCDRTKGTHACNKGEESVCVRLECLDPSLKNKCRPLAPAAEGSPCGYQKLCINGKCVHENTTDVLLKLAPLPTTQTLRLHTRGQLL